MATYTVRSFLTVAAVVILGAAQGPCLVIENNVGDTPTTDVTGDEPSLARVGPEEKPVPEEPIDETDAGVDPVDEQPSDDAGTLPEEPADAGAEEPVPETTDPVEPEPVEPEPVTEITGDVIVRSDADLERLRGVVTIHGSLTINQATTLAPLADLRRVDGALMINANLDALDFDAGDVIPQRSFGSILITSATLSSLRGLGTPLVDGTVELTGTGLRDLFVEKEGDVKLTLPNLRRQLAITYNTFLPQCLVNEVGASMGLRRATEPDASRKQLFAAQNRRDGCE